MSAKQIKSYSDARRRTKLATPPEGVEGFCRIWQGHSHNGQPQAKIDGKQRSVRRWLFQDFHGYLPPVVGSKCGNTMCCARDHLIPLEHKDVKRHSPALAVRKHVAKVASLAAPQVVLNMETARAIRSDSRPSAVVAAELGISLGHVNRIKAGKRWAEPCAFSAMAAALGGIAA